VERKATNGKLVLAVEPGDGVYVRIQVRSAANAIIAVSNPVWLLRERPPHAIPADRLRTLV
jgi:hypothetical protein